MKKTEIDKSLNKLIRYFFNVYLPKQRGLSRNTILSYKETFKIFIPWIEKKISTRRVYLDDISMMLVFEFLTHLEEERGNSIQTRNSRLAALKTFFKMSYLIHPETKKTFEAINFIQMKKFQTPTIDYFTHEEALKIFKSTKKYTHLGFRDYTLLNLLYDTGMRASEVVDLQISNYNSEEKTIELIGKGNKWRKINIWARTSDLLNKYIKHHRVNVKQIYKNTLFINQKGEPLTRSGLYKICQKRLENVPDLKKPFINSKRSPVHSWRHTAAINMIMQGFSLLEVKVRLGHSTTDSTLKYLNLDLTIKRERVNKFIDYINRSLDEELIPPSNWNQDKDVMDFLKKL